jgi:hypothetical protein
MACLLPAAGCFNCNRRHPKDKGNLKQKFPCLRPRSATDRQKNGLQRRRNRCRNPMTITLLRRKGNSNIRFISARMRGRPVRAQPQKPRAIGIAIPKREKADVARDPVGKVNNARRKMETLRLQIVAPPLKNFRRLATQRRRPIWVRRIHSAAPSLHIWLGKRRSWYSLCPCAQPRFALRE